MRKKKVLVVTGTRAEYGLLYPVIKEIRKSRSLQLRLLVTGMHTQKKFGSTINEIRRDGISISSVVRIKEKISMLEALAEEIKGIEKYCFKEKPDLILISADRGEAFAAAIVAGHLGIPVAHLSGGDVTGPVVDDLIRNAITKFSHVHFPLTQRSARRIKKMGEKQSRIFPFGTTALDDISEKGLLTRAQLAKQLKIDARKPWILFVQHPVALDITPLQKQINESLASLEILSSERIVIYPNSDNGSEQFVRALEQFAKKTRAVIARSFPRAVFLSILKNVDVMVGNSSSGIVEAGFFKTPVVDVGNRERGRERGINVISAPYERHVITKAITKALSPAFKRKLRTMKHPYGSGDTSGSIVRVLEKIDFDVLKNK